MNHFSSLTSRISSMLLLHTLLLLALNNNSNLYSINALSNTNPNNDNKISRRDALLYGTGATLGTLTSIAFLNKDARPEAHERRVSNAFNKAIKESSDLLSSSSPLLLAPSSSSTGTDAVDTNSKRNTFRILELGIGSDWKSLKRGLYNFDILSDVHEKQNKDIVITGVDLQEISESNMQKLQKQATTTTAANNIPIELNTIKGDICSKLPYADKYFDVITCCFTLCSVEDQSLALQEIQRLLKTKTGTFGFVEHVAVNKEEESKYEWLDKQQIFFDPLQQILADNCHLHRNTDSVILDTFGRDNVREYERFFVDSMWPVSCQSCGVVVKA